jgi:hypothetical protein
MNEVFGFDKGKRAIVDMNTALALMSGLAIRYHDGLKRVERLASIPYDPAGPALQAQVPEMQRAVAAEVPMAFSLEPSNMAVSVNAIKVDPNTGAEIPHSAVQVGLVGGLARDGQPSRDFTEEDLRLAVQRLREQKQAGLVYGLPDGSGFLADY